MWLETGSTALRAGRPADAERFLNDGLTRFADDTRPRMFGEEALWLYKRGAARAALKRTDEAERDLRQSLSLDGRDWVHGARAPRARKAAVAERENHRGESTAATGSLTRRPRPRSRYGRRSATADEIRVQGWCPPVGGLTRGPAAAGHYQTLS